MKHIVKVSWITKVISKILGGDYCPFCGCIVKPKKEKVYDSRKKWRVMCPHCDIRSIWQFHFFSRWEAVVNWRISRRKLELINLLTCKCDDCSTSDSSCDAIRQISYNADGSGQYKIYCSNCKRKVSRASVAESIDAWNGNNSKTVLKSFNDVEEFYSSVEELESLFSSN